MQCRCNDDTHNLKKPITIMFVTIVTIVTIPIGYTYFVGTLWMTMQ